MDKIKVVIVEDELIAAEYLKEIVEQNGAEVIDIIDTGSEAIKVCIREKPELIFMDIMLRDNVSGSEAAVAISRECDAKIIFLTAYVDEEMMDYAIEAHASAYLTKPYSEVQIVAAMRLAVSSGRTGKKPELSEEKPMAIALADGYQYDTVHKRLLKDNVEIELGPKALKLIELLCTQTDISVSNEQIAMHVWGELVNDRTLRSLLFRIRNATSDQLIKNVSGVGYMIKTH